MFMQIQTYTDITYSRLTLSLDESSKNGCFIEIIEDEKWYCGWTFIECKTHWCCASIDTVYDIQSLTCVSCSSEFFEWIMNRCWVSCKHNESCGEIRKLGFIGQREGLRIDWKQHWLSNIIHIWFDFGRAIVLLSDEGPAILNDRGGCVNHCRVVSE